MGFLEESLKSVIMIFIIKSGEKMDNSKIQWTDATVNFWTGCKKVSPGCKFCYMYRDLERYGKEPTEVMRTKPQTFNKALKWKNSRKIFTCSWSDFFIEEADQWRKDAWDVIRNTPQHNWQILTKRPERIEKCLPEDWRGKNYSHNYRNVWIGVSVESDSEVDRIEMLSDIPNKFVSFEPLLEKLEFHDDYLDYIDWAIIGGESGNDKGKYRYRECQIEWIEKLIEKLRDENIPVFVKQLGTHLAKKLCLKDRKGGNVEEWPKHLQVREFPKGMG